MAIWSLGFVKSTQRQTLSTADIIHYQRTPTEIHCKSSYYTNVRQQRYTATACVAPSKSQMRRPFRLQTLYTTNLHKQICGTTACTSPTYANRDTLQQLVSCVAPSKICGPFRLQTLYTTNVHKQICSTTARTSPT